MPTLIKLVESDALTVREDYRAVYETLLAAAWREPCEFTELGYGRVSRIAAPDGSAGAVIDTAPFGPRR
jgi:hypothetical protein